MIFTKSQCSSARWAAVAASTLERRCRRAPASLRHVQTMRNTRCAHRTYLHLMSIFFGIGVSMSSPDAFSRFPLTASMDSSIKGSQPSSLAGTWIRDQAASDMKGYSRILELLHLSGLQRTTALQLIEGLEFEETDDSASIRFLTVVPFFKVKEELDFTKTVAQGRRDLRPGKQKAQSNRTPHGLYVEMSWDEPYAGQLTETYHIDRDTLYVESSITVQEGSAACVVVYRRSEQGWKPKFKFPGR